MHKMLEFFQNSIHGKKQSSQSSGLRPTKLTETRPFNAMKTSNSLFQPLSILFNTLTLLGTAIIHDLGNQ